MKMIRKTKIYKELTLLWPNVDRIVKDAEGYLDMLAVPGQSMSFVDECALLAAKKARAIEYTDDYTYRKLMVFCEEFKACLLDLENMKISTKAGEWSPCDGPFKNFAKEYSEYTVGIRKKPVECAAYREMVEHWIKSHV